MVRMIVSISCWLVVFFIAMVLTQKTRVSAIQLPEYTGPRQGCGPALEITGTTGIGPALNILSLESPPSIIFVTTGHKKPDDAQIVFSLYGDRLHITCGKDVDVDEAAKIFFDEVLKPVVDMYIDHKIYPKSFSGEGITVWPPNPQ